MNFHDQFGPVIKLLKDDFIWRAAAATGPVGGPAGRMTGAQPPVLS